MKKTSARANYWRATNNLLALMDKKESATQAADSEPEDSNTAPKARASTKRRATKDAPAKTDSPPKHRKTSPMAAPETEPALVYAQEAEEDLVFTKEAN